MGIFEFLYYLGYSIKKYYSLRNQKRLPFRVISIGNITVGGTGKTPATIAIAEEAKRRGFRPIILTRGYKGRAKGPCFVQDAGYQIQDARYGIRDEKHHASYELFGDEPSLMVERLKDVPVVKCADRYRGGMFALQNLEDAETRRRGDTEINSLADSPIHRFTDSSIIFILDDGFQHWKLFRDEDILLIDAENPFGNRRLLPLGPLREPFSAISRADIIVVTKTDKSAWGQKSEVPPTLPSPSRGEGKGGGDRSQGSTANGLIEEISQYNSKAPIFLAEHKPLRFIKSSGEAMPLKWAEGKKFFAFCGVGNPKSFKKTILSTDCNLKGLKIYRDHYRYRQQDIENILKEAQRLDADWVVTTEKDLIRLKGLDIPENLIAIAIEFAVDKGFYDEVFK